MVKKIIVLLLGFLLLSTAAFAADTYSQGKIVKWESSTYPQKSKKMKTWIVYQLQADNTTYSIAREKETKPQMQAGEVVQYALAKKSHMNVIAANGKKREYQIIGQAANTGQ